MSLTWSDPKMSHMETVSKKRNGKESDKKFHQEMDNYYAEDVRVAHLSKQHLSNSNTDSEDSTESESDGSGSGNEI